MSGWGYIDEARAAGWVPAVADCPFCGSAADIAFCDDSFAVRCEDDDCGAVGPRRGDLAKAARAWNAASDREAYGKGGAS